MHELAALQAPFLPALAERGSHLRRGVYRSGVTVDRSTWREAPCRCAPNPWPHRRDHTAVPSMNFSSSIGANSKNLIALESFGRFQRGFVQSSLSVGIQPRVERIDFSHF